VVKGTRAGTPAAINLPAGVRYAVIEEYGRKCVYCGRSGDEKRDPDGRVWNIDHALAIGRGGTHESDNLRLACVRCNTMKGPMTPEEFLVEEGKRRER